MAKRKRPKARSSRKRATKAGDDVLNMPIALEGEEMPPTTAETELAIDVPDDIFQHTMQEGMEAHDNQMTETVANISHSHNIARSVGVKKFNEVGAIESAAAEVVLRIKPVT